jgi:hypothetical protein
MCLNDIHLHMGVSSPERPPTVSRGIGMEVVIETTAAHVLGTCDSGAYVGMECEAVVDGRRNC